jgi:hypothetical protein
MPKSLKTEIIQIILQHRGTEFKGIFVPFRKYNSKENFHSHALDMALFDNRLIHIKIYTFH